MALFLGLPLLLYFMGDFPRKTLLKEALSIITILAFSAMLAQFYFTRHNKQFKKGKELTMAVKLHRIIGYSFIVVLLLHPFFIVLPRFFEAGADPGDAFITLITEFSSLGVVLGLIAYGLMIVIFMTTIIRNRFHLNYRLGRMFHGCLSVLFIVAAAWHVINIGRHANTPFAIYIILMTGSGIIHLFLTYYFESRKEIQHG